MCIKGAKLEGVYQSKVINKDKHLRLEKGERSLFVLSVLTYKVFTLSLTNMAACSTNLSPKSYNHIIQGCCTSTFAANLKTLLWEVAANNGADITNCNSTDDTTVKDLDDIFQKVGDMKLEAKVDRVRLMLDGDKLKAKASTHDARAHCRHQ